MKLSWVLNVHAAIQAEEGPLCVACSGGADSLALLHLLSDAAPARRRGLRVLHVDHALNPRSADWAETVQRYAAQWRLPCAIVRLEPLQLEGEGLEAAARKARYQVFSAELRSAETLVLGHHHDDQVETILLKLLRGAGPDGLRGMRERRPLGRGWLWRPLLGVTREQLTAYAQAQGLAPVQDPSNQDTRYARNWLRHTILPALQQRWPQTGAAIVQAARCCGEAADALEPIWRQHYARLLDPATGSLPAKPWLALPLALRIPLLHHWLHAQQLTAPSTLQYAQIEQQIQVRDGRVPRIQWQNTELYIWRGRLWAQPLRPAPPLNWRCRWQGEPLQLPDGGSWALVAPKQALPPLELRLRQGGERIRLAGETQHRDVSGLLQQAGVPPWRRGFVPLLYQADELMAVGMRWRSAQGQALFEACGGWAWQPVLRIDSGAGLG